MSDATEQPIFRNRSANIAKLATALSTAQKNFAPIPKDREVTVTTQTGGTYKFKYATLDAICAATFPALAEQGLAVSQALTNWGDNYALETSLFHSSGEWVSNVTPMFLSGRRTREGKELPPGNQELGSAQTYARRYGLSALLCITADEDDDANHADGNHAEGTTRTPYRATAGAAGGGGQFRPERRQASISGARMAAEEPHLIDNDRKKGTLAKPAAVNAVEQMQWIKDSRKIVTDCTTKGELSDWWRQNQEARETAAAAVPVEYDKLIVLFDDRMTTLAGAPA